MPEVERERAHTGATRESDLPKVGKMLLRIGYARASVPGLARVVDYGPTL